MMKQSNINQLLHKLAEEETPAASISLSRGVKERLERNSPRLRPTHPVFKTSPAVLGLVVVIALTVIAITAFPQGRAFAQRVFQFFAPTDSDVLPPVDPTVAQTSPEEADLQNADPEIAGVLSQAGYDVLMPTWLPDLITRTGATYEAETGIVRLFFTTIETNGMVLAKQPVDDGNCSICSPVGASANIEVVQIASETGEYVQGVWKLTENGQVWESDPYLQTLRWVKDGIACELLYMGDPEQVTKDDLIAIAASMK
jgi:hypothetical protein